jgi:hypothetical protein
LIAVARHARSQSDRHLDSRTRPDRLGRGQNESREAAKIWREQNLPGNLVLTTGANAAAHHLVHEVAIELAPLVRVNGIAPAAVVPGSTMFPRDDVIGLLAKYKIPCQDDEPTESLVDKLARFYAGRALVISPVTQPTRPKPVFFWFRNGFQKPPGRSSRLTEVCPRPFRSEMHWETPSTVRPAGVLAGFYFVIEAEFY